MIIIKRQIFILSQCIKLPEGSGKSEREWMTLMNYLMKHHGCSFSWLFFLKKKKKNLMSDKTGSKYTQITPRAYAFWEVSTVFWLCLIISNYVLQHKIKYFYLHCVYLFMSWALIVKQCILLFIYTRCEYLCCSVQGSQLGLYLYTEPPSLHENGFWALEFISVLVFKTTTT